MKHNIEEIWTIPTPFKNGDGYKNNYYVEGYLVANNIARLTYKQRMALPTNEARHTAPRPVTYLVGRDAVKIHNANGEQMLIYMYGEKTWFDTREERDAYRKEQQELNRPRKENEPMRVKDLIKILKSFDGNTRVRLFDEANGIIDITEVQEGEGVFKGDLVIV